MSRARVYVLADQAIYRASLRHALTDADRHVVVGHSGSVGPTLAELKRLRPDVVLLDASPAGLPEDHLRIVRAVCPSSCVVLLVDDMSADVSVESALEAGFNAVIAKDAMTTELGQAIDSVRRGQHFVSVGVHRYVTQPGAPQEDES